MKLYLNHSYKYAIEQITMVLFPGEKPEYPSAEPERDESACRSRLRESWGRATARTELSVNGQHSAAEVEAPAPPEDGDSLERDRILQRILKQSYYKAALPLLGEAPPWGALTGIRPAKLASKALESGLAEEETRTLFRTEYFVSESRTKLALEAAKAGLTVKKSLKEDEISLYIGIPFCPTRCAYCSFISADVHKALKLVEPYLTALIPASRTV